MKKTLLVLVSASALAGAFLSLSGAAQASSYYGRSGPEIRDHRGPMPEIRDHRVKRRPPGDFFVRKDKGPRAIPNAGRGQGGIKVTLSNRPRENVRDHR